MQHSSDPGVYLPPSAKKSENAQRWDEADGLLLHHLCRGWRSADWLGTPKCANVGRAVAVGGGCVGGQALLLLISEPRLC